MSKSYSVSCYGVSHADIILLEFLLSLLEKTTDSQWTLVNDMSGDITIVDIEKKTGNELYEKKILEANEKITIGLSSNLLLTPEEYHLKKPLRTPDFISLIKDILDNRPEIGKDKPDNKNAVTANPISTNTYLNKKNTVNINIKRPTKKRLYNLLTENYNRYASLVKISHQGTSLYLDLSCKHFYYKDNLMSLSSLFKVDISALDITEEADTEFKKQVNKLSYQSLEALLWCSTLLGSSGELNKDINKKTLLHLRRWPNLKSLYHLPVHLSLAAFMTSHSSTLLEIINATNTPPETAVDFINACISMNYISIDVTNDDTGTADIKNHNEEINLFELIRNRFSIDTPD